MIKTNTYFPYQKILQDLLYLQYKICCLFSPSSYLGCHWSCCHDAAVCSQYLFSCFEMEMLPVLSSWKKTFFFADVRLLDLKIRVKKFSSHFMTHNFSAGKTCGSNTGSPTPWILGLNGLNFVFSFFRQIWWTSAKR